MKTPRIVSILSLLFLLVISSSAFAAPRDYLDDVHRWADLATEALIDQYWLGPNSDFAHFGWGQAQGWDAFMDAVERTGGQDSPYFPYVDNVFRRQSMINPTFINEFNDDMAWWALASIRAYHMTNDLKFYNRAILLWNTIIRSWDEELGGGIWWRNDEKGGKNACINAPASIIASKLYQITGDREYLEWAIKLYEWTKVNLAPTGLVWDNINPDGEIWTATFTYNQGTYIGAAVELYKITGDPMYLEDAQQTAHLSMTRLTGPNGILLERGQGDGGGFKGIFVRYLISLLEVDPEPEPYINFLVKHAVSVGENVFNDLNLVGPNWAQREDVNVEMLTHVSGVMLLNLTASVLEKEAEYGIEILHPAWETTVMANDPVSFQLTPSLDIAELSVFENGVEVYRGTDVPDELRLSAPIEEEGEWHRLTVRVTDSDGDVRQRYTRYQVRRLALDIPELSHGRVHGELPIGLHASFPPHSPAGKFQLALTRISGHLTEERTVVYEGTTLPEHMVLDSTSYSDGAYDLELIAFDPDGSLITQIEHRLVIRNWDTEVESFRPPFIFFGAPIDSLLTESRSDGWVFHVDDPEIFFGDTDRVAPAGTGEEYLIWHFPGLQRFGLTAYTTDAGYIESIDVSVSSDMAIWHPLEVQIDVLEESDFGWTKFELAGNADVMGDHEYLRVEVSGADLDETTLQLGELVMMRPVGM